MLALLSSAACSPREPRPNPSPVPKAVTDTPATGGTEDNFVVVAESFADVRLLRYRVRGFQALSLPQKTLLYYLQEAALSGRDITYDQKFEHNLTIRRTLEAVAKESKDTTSDAYRALLVYLKRIWFSNGIHDVYSSRKILPEGLSRAAFEAFVRKVDPKALPRLPSESVDAFLTRITPIIFDPAIAAQGVNKNATKDPVADSANHFYVGLKKEQVSAHLRAQQTDGGATPISFGLNSQLVAKKDGGIEERVWRVGGMYGAALEECVRWLEKAASVAENPAQQTALRALITFYQSGKLEDFDAYGRDWLKDTESSVDLIHGFIETYGDPMGLRGTYEALVELVDAEGTRRIRTLADQAAWFEAHSPIADALKKQEIVGIHARVVEAVIGAGDTAPAMPIGVNLPNSHWIRERFGSKSVTLGNLLAAYEAESRDNGVLQEFAASEHEVTRARAHSALATALLVDMHEVIGHASGKLADGVGDITATLHHYGSTLEEARADLVALYYLLDPKLIALKLMPSLDVGRAAYDAYVRGALVQIATVPQGETLEEDHMRNHQLIVHWAIQEGAKYNVIEQSERDGKTFYAVRDYPKLRKLFGQLLAEIQRIKSEGDFPAARTLVETYGVKIDPALHTQIRARYADLHVAPHAGFIQPELVPVTKADQIVDIRIEYPTDFAAQELRYSAKYSFLPATN